jgi:ribonuclease J
MAKLTFYGGVNEIGGNKILLEDGKGSLFLDFGFPFAKHKNFYEEFLKPRGGAGLLDPLEMGLLPKLDGIYRSDLESQTLWDQFRDDPFYRKVENVEGVLLTHAHQDHSGHIAFLKQEIPVFSTAITALTVKAVQDTGKAEYDQQVCYYSPTSLDYPTGWKQRAFLSGNEAKLQRRFCISDMRPEDLDAVAKEFWANGFWERTPRQRGIASCELNDHSGCAFNIKCFPVDHSILGACAWGIETGSGWIVYSGDLRLHGKRSGLTRKFI